LESIAESLRQELEPFGIKVQTINPAAYLTGYNETMADIAFRWLDDSKNFTQRAAMRATFDSLFGTPEGRLDPEEMQDLFDAWSAGIGSPFEPSAIARERSCG
jgi:NAD(P)-dependent dehydrogenase (short-subunit alcohol dehydrogenase family)